MKGKEKEKEKYIIRNMLENYNSKEISLLFIVHYL